MLSRREVEPMRRGILYLLAVIVGVALALSQPRLTVTTDSSFYEPGSAVTVIVSGPPRAPVGLEVRGPRGELVGLKQLTLDAKGTASFTFLLDPHCAEGVYTVYVATPGAAASTTFEVVSRPSPLILLAPPGQVSVGETAGILCFVYPGLQLGLSVYVRRAGEDWALLGAYESNSSGWLIVPFTPTIEGVYEVKVEFAGSLQYGPASATARFRVVQAAPPRWRIEAPPLKWLGETIKINCTGFDQVVARTVAGERTYRCGTEIRLEVPGPLILYPAKGDVLGAPSVTMVRARLSTVTRAPQEVGLNEPFLLAALLTPPAPAVRVSFVDAQGSLIAEAISRMNGTAIARAALSKVGDYLIKAVPHPTSVFEVGDCAASSLRVLGERIYVRLTILDAAGRRLYNSIVEVSGERYEAPMGVAEFAVRAGEYYVTVRWRGLTVYAGKLRLDEHNVTLVVPLYDLKVVVVDFLGRPAAGELVELYNGTERIAAGITGSDGQLAIIRIPPGTYTVRVGDVARAVSVPEEGEVRLVLPPSPWLLAVAALTITAATAIVLARGWARKRRKRR